MSAWTRRSDTYKQRHAVLAKRYYKKTRERVNAFKAGGCIICGYKKCYAALHLHHINPSSKRASLHQLLRAGCSALGIKREMEKCLVVCANCHFEIHEGLHPEYLIEPAVADSKDVQEQLELAFG